MSSLDLSEYEKLIGRDLPQPEQFLYGVTEDSIRHFAYCIPDYNGLYLDHEYARTTRWGSIIAPPGYLYAHGTPAWLSTRPGIKDATGQELDKGGNAGEAWEFFRPVRPGDRVYSYGKIIGVEVKRGRKLGDCALTTEIMRYTNDHNELVATLTLTTFRFRDAAVDEAGGVTRVYPPMEPGQYTRNKYTFPRLPGTVPTPVRRVDSLRYFEDLEIGEELPKWELGPLMVYHVGAYTAVTIGMGTDGIGKMGSIPDAFAPGVMRTQWFGAMISQWAGPHCFLTKVSHRNEEWLLVGFKVICGGRVRSKSVVDGRCLVDLDVWCDSELGFRGNSGFAQVEIPSRTQS
jgi:acyl dehydratase